MNARSSAKPATRSSATGTTRAARAARDARPKPVARFRMRVMSDETIAVGPGKIALLEAIRDTHSITAAALSIGMSYRRAWMLVDELNAALKKPAVVSAKGGDHGGGSALTADGDALVRLYRRIETRATKACATEIGALLARVR